jgi:hypothetical protein
LVEGDNAFCVVWPVLVLTVIRTTPAAATLGS